MLSYIISNVIKKITRTIIILDFLSYLQCLCEMSETLFEIHCENFHNKNDELIHFNGPKISSNETEDSAVREIPQQEETKYLLCDENTNSEDSDGTDTKTCDSDKELKDCDVHKVLNFNDDQYCDNGNASEGYKSDGTDGYSDGTDGEYESVTFPVNVEEEEKWDDYSDEYWEPVRETPWCINITEQRNKAWTPVEGQFDDAPDDIS